MWNDTDIPLAYLITSRCYGTWLHGDERGSIDRFHNRYKSPYISPNENWRSYNAEKLRGDPVTLNAAQRESVEAGVRETCELRGWLLRAANVRTNHVHAVVSVGAAKPERVLNAFKANATRQCDKTVAGKGKIVRGPIRAAKSICGMSAALNGRSIISSSVKAMSYRSLIEMANS